MMALVQCFHIDCDDEFDLNDVPHRFFIGKQGWTPLCELHGNWSRNECYVDRIGMCVDLSKMAERAELEIDRRQRQKGYHPWVDLMKFSDDCEWMRFELQRTIWQDEHREVDK